MSGVYSADATIAASTILWHLLITDAPCFFVLCNYVINTPPNPTHGRPIMAIIIQSMNRVTVSITTSSL